MKHYLNKTVTAWDRIPKPHLSRLERILAIPGLRPPLYCGPESELESYGVPSAVAINTSGYIIPSALKDFGCGYSLVKVQPNRRLTRRFIDALKTDLYHNASLGSRVRAKEYAGIDLHETMITGLEYLKRLGFPIFLPDEAVTYVDADKVRFSPKELAIAKRYIGVCAGHFLLLGFIDKNKQNPHLQENDYILLIHCGIFRMQHVLVRRYNEKFMTLARETGQSRESIDMGIFGVPVESKIVQAYLSDLMALHRYSLVLRNLAIYAFHQALNANGVEHQIQLISDIPHTILTANGTEYLHQRGIQMVNACQLCYVGGTKETPALIFESKANRQLIPHGSEGAKTCWRMQGESVNLKRIIANCVFDTNPDPESCVRKNYQSLLNVKNKILNTNGFDLMGRIIPLMNLQGVAKNVPEFPI